MQELPRGAQLGARIDTWLSRRARRAALGTIAGFPIRKLDSAFGSLRYVDTESARPCVLITPDGPNVIEHYEALIARLAPVLRVVCFDMPGFGFSAPARDYRHTLDQGAGAVFAVLDELRIASASLAFSCANGFYALRAAKLEPARIASLFLSQTPSLEAMQAWTLRVVPGPLRVPVLGQTTNWLARKQLARRWYDMALPRETSREPYHSVAQQALARGACFSLSGVVQGLTGESQSALVDVQTPCTMIWGNQDHTHRATDPTSLLACAPQAEILRLDRTGHFPDLERQTRFAELLIAHIVQLQQRRARELPLELPSP